MSTYLPTSADGVGPITPIESQGRYAVATFELFQASTDALDDLASRSTVPAGCNCFLTNTSYEVLLVRKDLRNRSPVTTCDTGNPDE